MSWLRRTIANVSLILGLALAINNAMAGNTPPLQLPEMGEAIDSFMSAQQEQQLGKAFMRNVRRSLPVMDDPQISRYIQSLGQRLAAHSNQPQQAFHFFVVNNPSINAFAGPGGYIGIHSGLILASQTEDELAAVIAHELAHVTQRHLARAYESATNMSLPMTAAIIAAIILSGQPELGQLGEATLASAAAGSIQQQINFTRSNEQEADRIGMQTLTRAGYSSTAMQHFFERLLQASQYQEDTALEFLRTHPLTSSRIAGSQNLLTPPTPSKPQTTQQHFALMQARIHVMSTTELDALPAFFKAREDVAGKYGRALTAIQQRDYQQAQDLLLALSQQEPDNLSYTLAQIENELANGSTQRALSLLENKLHLYPDDGPLTLLYGRTLLKDGQYAKARSLLRKHLHKVEATPMLYSLLAEAEGKSGDRSATHQAMAEFHFLNGDSTAALKQIQLALEHGQKLTNNELVRIQSRLKEIQQVLSAEDGN